MVFRMVQHFAEDRFYLTVLGLFAAALSGTSAGVV